MDDNKWLENIDMNKITVEEFLIKCMENVSEEKKKQWKIKFCVKKIIEVYLTTYGNCYEALLLLYIERATNPQDKQTIEQHLRIYYKFIIAFELEPLFVSSQDSNSIYNAVCNTTSCMECKTLYKQAYCLITSNCKSPEELSKHVMTMLCTYMELKPTVEQLLKCSKRMVNVLCEDLQSLL